MADDSFFPLHRKTPLSFSFLLGKWGEQLSYLDDCDHGKPMAVLQRKAYQIAIQVRGRIPQTLTPQLLQFREVLDGTDHLRGVAVFV